MCYYFLYNLFYYAKELIKFFINPDIHYEILNELGPI